MKYTTAIAGLTTLLCLPGSYGLPLGNAAAPVTGVVEPVLRDVQQRVQHSKLPTTLREATPQLLQPGEQIAGSLNRLPEAIAIKNPLGEVVFRDIEMTPGVRVVEHEWLIWINQQALPLLQQANLRIIEQKHLPALNLSYVRVRTDQANDSRDYIESLLPAGAALQIQRNFIFAAQADSSAADVEKAQTQPLCDSPLPVGMIDTAIELSHPALASASINPRRFIADTLQAPVNHGTSVASLLVASSADYQGMIPQAQLFAASVFYQRDAYSQGATSESLINALNWLAENKVAVINMSLAGPDDPLLAFALQQVTANGIVVVAAVGNAGPASSPLYPAAYADTIAVTAVDNDNAVYRWAVQGEHVDIAAQGVRMQVARAAGGFSKESGTSLAAPLVSGFIACQLAQQHRGDASSRLPDIRRALAQHAIDLGSAGKDPVFGMGRLQWQPRPEQQLSGASTAN